MLNRKEENDRINFLLTQEPEFGLIKKSYDHLVAIENSIAAQKEQIAKIQERIKETELGKQEAEEYLKELLLRVESNTGYARMPIDGVTVYLREVAQKVEVTAPDAVPSEFIVHKPQVDKRKLNAAIEAGQIDLTSNWLKVVPAYKTVCIK